MDGIESPAPAFDAARPEDVPDLVAIDASSPTPWSAAAFEAEVSHVPPTIFVLREADRPLAFVSARVQAPDLDIVNVAVAAARRRSGLGRLLIRKLLESPAARGVEKVFLEVRESNAAALALYRGMGFEETQRRRNFYRDPVEDAVLMMLRLNHQ